MEIKEAFTVEEIESCFPVLQTLRLHFTDVSEFVPRVQSQQKAGYHLVYLRDEGAVQAIAGYRIREHLETADPRYLRLQCMRRTAGSHMHSHEPMTLPTCWQWCDTGLCHAHAGTCTLQTW